MNIGKFGVLGCFLLGACGEAPPLGEDVATSQEAVETAYDAPPAAGAVEVRVDADQRLWVFACDSSNNLKRKVRLSPTGNWTVWMQVATDCFSTPAVGTWAWVDGTEEIFVFFRNSNNQLMRVYYSSNGAVPTIDNASMVSGFGAINGSPRFVDYGNCDTCGPGGSRVRSARMVVRTPNNDVAVLGWNGSTFVSNPVLLGAAAGAPTINSQNTISTRGRAWALNAFPIGWMVGRGLFSNNDSAAWLAKSASAPFFWAMTESWVGSLSGTGTLTSTGTEPRIVQRFGADLRYKPEMGMGSSWTTLPNCAIDGSPQTIDTQNGLGYVRSSTGRFMEFSTQSGSEHCTTFAPFVHSAILPISYAGSSEKALYKGPSNALMFYQKLPVVTFIPLGLTLL